MRTLLYGQSIFKLHRMHSAFVIDKWLRHLFNGLFIAISIRKKLNVVCFNLPNRI